jgi:cell division protein FtsI/penicillin-binding protein 2
VDRLVDPDGTTAFKYSPQEVRRVVSEEAAAEMVEALKTVVTEDGTASGASLANYTVAGKTGTAQKAGVGGYTTEKFFSSFIGFFPADNPEILIYVAMDSPKGGHYGGETAAPLFKEVAEKSANYLNIRPDKTTAPGLPEKQAAAAVEPMVKTASVK